MRSIHKTLLTGKYLIKLPPVIFFRTFFETTFWIHENLFFEKRQEYHAPLVQVFISGDSNRSIEFSLLQFIDCHDLGGALRAHKHV